MAKVMAENPFHAGELEAQALAGAGDVAQWAGGFIRDHLPEQHRDFHTSLPFLVISGANTDGRTWITLVDGGEGFIRSPNSRSLTLETKIDDQDPLATAFASGTEVGVIGIELATRRRNRFNGQLRKSTNGYDIEIGQTFGNCPQYIHERAWTRTTQHKPARAVIGTELSHSQIALIQGADTLFIGSGHQKGDDVPSRGYDASHRGGVPGFVHVRDSGHVQIPDYAGNNFFNTIGNLITDPRVGLVFVDFETGGLLHISGRATVDWQANNAHDPDALRTIDVEIDAVIERPGAVALRWATQDHLSRRLKIARRETEADAITSFYLTPLDGKPLKPFDAGQHLPIEVQIPGQVGTSKRSYSLSGSPDVTEEYRLSIKRDDNGLVSRFLHDELREGSVIDASSPSGDFVIPCSNCPLVLVSAGVGLTPMVSMLHTTLSDENPRPIWFIHGTKNGTTHAMRQEVKQLIARHQTAKQRVAYSRPNPDDVVGIDYDVAGRVSVETLLELNAGSDAQYMLCGPVKFLSEITLGLEASGIALDRIHFETFGPGS